MPEYINKDKLLDDIECIDICDCTDVDDIFTEVERTIDDQPTADVAEVKHGKWIKDRNRYTCSECVFYYFANNSKANYCPNCGAKMDKE